MQDAITEWLARHHLTLFASFFSAYIFPALFHAFVTKMVNPPKGSKWERADALFRSLGFDPTILQKREQDIDDAVRELAGAQRNEHRREGDAPMPTLPAEKTTPPKT
jgi:hypothetical protein